MNKQTVGIITFEQFHGRANIGSSRIRGHWLAKYWDEAEIYKTGEKYDVMIYQKAYWLDHAKAFEGIKILDICDADWLHWQYRIIEMINLCDAVTTSTEALAVALRQFTDKPVLCIPDRLDLELHKEKKIHEGDAKTVVWFGYKENSEILKSTYPFLKNLNLDLIIISNKNVSLPTVYENIIKLDNFKWDIETVNRDILKGDIVLNPFQNKGKWKFKSNNKTITAWALGMPVARNADELKKLIKEDARIEESNKRVKEVKEKYDIKISIEEFKNLINEIVSKK